MLELNFHPFPELHTKRLLLRKFTYDDQEPIFELRSDRSVMKYIPRPVSETLEDARKHIELILQKIDANEGINWGIEELSSKKLIGVIGLFKVDKENYRAEVGYMLNSKWHNQGFMHEALQAVIDFGFKDMKLHSIEAIIDPLNEASANLLLKHKFRKEGHYLENCYFEGTFLDSVVFSLVKGIDYK